MPSAHGLKVQISFMCFNSGTPFMSTSEIMYQSWTGQLPVSRLYEVVCLFLICVIRYSEIINISAYRFSILVLNLFILNSEGYRKVLIFNMDKL